MKKFLFPFFIVLFCSLSTRLVSQAGAPVANFSATPYNICPGEAVQFTDMSLNNPTSWIWNFHGGTPASSTLQNPVIVYNLPGSYDIVLTASNTNGVISKGVLSMVKVMVCSGLSEHNDIFNFQMFPNPTRSSVNITARIDAHYVLYNTIGSALLNGTIVKDEITKVTLDSLPAGIYFFTLYSNTSSKSYKFIKE